MKLHEYQAKEILWRFGIPVPNGRVASSPREAVEVARELSLPVVVKAQVHAGGRGKAGAIKRADTFEEIFEVSSKILGMQLSTYQTGGEARVVRKVLVEEAKEIAHELYVGIALARSEGIFKFIASPSGGMDIEAVAKNSPEKIFKVDLDPDAPPKDDTFLELWNKFGLSHLLGANFAAIAASLCRLYVETDASLVEINPLAVTQNGLIALDAKLVIDDNALFRHKEFLEFVDPDEEDPREMAAKKCGLSYVSIGGNIGCMVNGAGLAMATMDIIKLHGGRPANFLDVGGTATRESVREAFGLILTDPNVKVIFVNIFGGIVKCDLIASGIRDAASDLKIDIPLVVRLEGTNVEEGRRLLEDSRLNIFFKETLDDAARLAVELSKKE